MSGCGFGDALSVSEVVEREEMLLRTFYAAATHHVAKTHSPSDEAFDDLVQEGVLAAVRATSEPRTDPATYGAVAARRQISQVAAGRRPMTGSENAGSKTYDMARQRDRREDFAVVVELSDRRETYAAVEQRVDMERAMAHLDERDRALALLVSLEVPWDEAGEHVGMSARAARQRWHWQVKPVLREALERSA